MKFIWKKKLARTSRFFGRKMELAMSVRRECYVEFGRCVAVYRPRAENHKYHKKSWYWKDAWRCLKINHKCYKKSCYWRDERKCLKISHKCIKSPEIRDTHINVWKFLINAIKSPDIDACKCLKILKNRILKNVFNLIFLNRKFVNLFHRSSLRSAMCWKVFSWRDPVTKPVLVSFVMKILRMRPLESARTGSYSTTT